MNPVFWKVGSLEIRWYGIMIAIGFLAAVGLAVKRAKKTGFDAELVPNLSFWIILGGFTMARALYVILNWQNYVSHPIEIIRIDHGGIVYYGGLVGGALATFLYARRRKISFWRLADLMTPSLVLAHAFGRVGCFINGCCYGRACSLPWGVEYAITTVVGWGPGAPIGPVHPTQLYEAAFLFYLCVALIFIDATKKFQGQTLASYGLLYSMFRFCVEFWRGDVPRFSNLTVAQWFSLLIFFTSWWWLTRQRKRWAAARRAALMSEVEKLKAQHGPRKKE